MKKRKLKSFVLPTLYVLVIGVLFLSIAYLGKTLQSQISGEVPVMKVVEENYDIPVIKEEEEPIIDDKPMKPYISDQVKISKSYYKSTDDSKKQENSLVYYEKTYLQNTGILYTCDDEFDVVSVSNGTVTNIGNDEIMGNYVEITHNTNLKTIYYSLNNIVVHEGDTVNAGTIIAVSGKNMLEEATENSLLFEVYYNGYTMDPEDFYETNLTNLD